MVQDETPALHPLVFIADKVDDALRFCLRQALYIEKRGPLLLICPEQASVPAGVTRLSPQSLGVNEVFNPSSATYVLRILAACCQYVGSAACWYLAGNTLLFDALTWPESYLPEAHLAAALAPDGMLAALYIRQEAAASLIMSDKATLSLEAAADELGLIYERLDEVRMGHVFCTSLSDTQAFRQDERSVHKQIVWVHRQPFFVSSHTGLVARAVTLHLPGPLAGRLHRYYTGPGMLLQKLKGEARLLIS